MLRIRFGRSWAAFLDRETIRGKDEGQNHQASFDLNNSVGGEDFIQAQESTACFGQL